MKSLLRLARCRHPKGAVGMWGRLAYCELCGAVRVYGGGNTWSRWTRPRLVLALLDKKPEVGT